MAKPLDLRLNAIVDPERAGGHDLVELARLVAQGGATLVQLRDKTQRHAADDRGGARDPRLRSPRSAFRSW